MVWWWGFIASGACPDDCDDDGWTVGMGDCDDDDALVNPVTPEACGNALDDNCDGLFNEGCERSVQLGRPGGGGCGSRDDESGGALALFVPLWWRRRR